MHKSLREAWNSTQGFSFYVNPGRLGVQLLLAGRSGAAIQTQWSGWFLWMVRCHPGRWFHPKTPRRRCSPLVVCWLSLAEVSRSLADEGPSNLAGGGVWTFICPSDQMGMVLLPPVRTGICFHSAGIIKVEGILTFSQLFWWLLAFRRRSLRPGVLLQSDRGQSWSLLKLMKKNFHWF